MFCKIASYFQENGFGLADYLRIGQPHQTEKCGICRTFLFQNINHISSYIP